MSQFHSVTSDGYFPDAAGELHTWLTVLRVDRTPGATVKLEYSRDDGATWEPAAEPGRLTRVAYFAPGVTRRVRVVVTGYTRPFGFWLEDRK